MANEFIIRNGFISKSGSTVQDTLNVSGNTTSPAFVTIGGTEFQFVKGDGSLDSNTYLTGTTIDALDGYVPYSGATNNVDLGSYNLTIGTTITDINGDSLLFNLNDLIINSKHLNSAWGVWVRQETFGTRKYGIDSFNNKLDFYTNGSIKASIVNSTGNFGIGTDTPDTKLHISGSTDVIQTIDTNGAFDSYTRYVRTGDSGWAVGRDNTNGEFKISYLTGDTPTLGTNDYVTINDNGDTYIDSAILSFATNGSGTNNLYFQRNSSNNWSLRTNAGVGNIWTVAGNSQTFYQVGTHANGLNITPGGNSTTYGLRITSGSYPNASLLIVDNDALVVSGNSVGVGTNAPTEKLHVSGNTLVTGRVTATGATLTGLSNQPSELTALMIDGSNIVGTRELGTSAFVASGTSANDTTITLSAGTDLTTGGDFTTNQATPETITFNHANITRSDSTSGASPAHGGTFTAVDSVTSTARGHITAINVKTVTLPSATVNTNDYVTSASFASGTTGILTLTRLSGGTVTVDLDGRYLEAHPPVSAAASSNNSGRTYIQDILLDTFGHITGITTSTETVVNTDDYVTSGNFNTTTGDLTLTRLSGGTVVTNLDNRYTLTGNTAIADNQVAVGTGTGIEGTTGLTYNGSLLQIAGDTYLSNGNFNVINDKGFRLNTQETGMYVSSTTGITFKYNNFAVGSFNTAGLLKLNAYGGGTVTGTSTYTLAVDTSGNVVEIPLVTDTTYSNGVGLDLVGTVFSHADTSTQASSNNGGRTYIQDILLDTFGHITGLTTSTETVSAANDTTITLSAGTGLTLGGDFTTNQATPETISFAHADTSSQASSNNSGRTYIQDITLDDFGHVTAIGTATETVTDTTYSNGVGLDLIGTVFSHSDTSTQASSNNSGRTYIQDILLDTFGHITGLTTSTETVTDTTYSNGVGLDLIGTVFSHADTSSQASSNNSGRTYIQDILLDTFGHITGLTTSTETVSAANDATITLSAGTGLTLGGAFTTDQASNETISFNLDYLGTDNFIDVATNLEGTPISSGDTIIYHDASDNNIKKGLVTDLSDVYVTLHTNQTITAPKGMTNILSFNASAGGAISLGSTNSLFASSTSPFITRSADKLAFMTTDNGGSQRFLLFDGSAITGSAKTATWRNLSGTVAFLDDISGITGGTLADDYVVSGTFSATTGNLNLTRISGTTVTVNLDGRYLASSAFTATNLGAGNLISTVLPYVTASGTNSAFKVPFANTTSNTSGNYGLLMDNSTNFTYNPSTNTIASLNLASTVIPYFTAVATNSAFKVAFANTTGNASGNFASYIDSSANFSYNPSTNTLTTANLTLDGLSPQNSEFTALMINDSNVVGTRELGTGAFVASGGTGGINGNGTTNYVPKWTGSTSLGNSIIYDNGTNVGIGTASPDSISKLNIISPAATGYWGLLLQDSGISNWSGFYSDTSNNYSFQLRNGGGTMTGLLTSSGTSYFNGGTVGIGTTTPNGTGLHISGTRHMTSGNSIVDGVLVIEQGGGERMFIDGNDIDVSGVTLSASTLYLQDYTKGPVRVGGNLTVGLSQTNSSVASSIGGGSGNTISTSNTITPQLGYYNVIGGGTGNEIAGLSSLAGTLGNGSNFIGGGKDNTINTTSSYGTGNRGYNFIGGGSGHTIVHAIHSVVVGGEGNRIDSSGGNTYSSIVGGRNNNAGPGFAFIGGGLNNIAAGYGGTVSGGYNNSTGGYRGFIGGGNNNNNSSSGYHNVIAGGQSNSISGSYCADSVICGGNSNSISSYYSDGNFIGGGFDNTISVYANGHNTISAGYRNTITGGTKSYIGGGENNNVGHSNAFVLGSNITTTQANTTYIQNLIASGGGAFTADVTVPDEVYGAGWNGSLEVPTKNALYDKIQTISSTYPGGVNGDIQYNNSGTFGGFGQVNTYTIDLDKPLLLEPWSSHPNASGQGAAGYGEYGRPEFIVSNSSGNARNSAEGQYPNYLYSAYTATTNSVFIIDWTRGGCAFFQLNSNCTIQVTSIPDGASGTILVKQDGTGARVVTWQNGISLTNITIGATTAINATANKYSTVTYKRNGSILIWVYGQQA